MRVRLIFADPADDYRIGVEAASHLAHLVEAVRDAVKIEAFPCRIALAEDRDVEQVLAKQPIKTPENCRSDDCERRERSDRQFRGRL